MSLNNTGVVSCKAKKFCVMLYLLFVVCITSALVNISAANYNSKIERLVEYRLPATKQELRKILISIFPSSYIFSYRLTKDIITYSLGTLGSKLTIDKNTAYAKGSLNNSKIAGIPIWNDIAIYKGKSEAYKYYPPASWNSNILTLGLDNSLLLHHRIGLIMNYTISSTKISYGAEQQNKTASSTQTIKNHGLILLLYYQYLDTQMTIDCSFLAGELQQKSNKEIYWLQTDHKSSYKSVLYSANLNLNYPCFVNKAYFDIILSNNLRLIKNPDINIEDISSIRHSTIKLLRSGAGIRVSYRFPLTNFSIYSSVKLDYNYNFYLDGNSKIDMMYLGKNFYIKDCLIEKNSFGANLDIILTVKKNLNIGINATWIKEHFSGSVGGRLFLYYYF